jgi:hypothetical protein
MANRYPRRPDFLPSAPVLYSSLHQLWAFLSRWVVGTTRGAAIVPDSYGLQAGDANDTASFDNDAMFHGGSLE